ncbi:PilZ domain-containing protein [bacterium]|nr:PilZ domain-containing protein [bacterium]
MNTNAAPVVADLLDFKIVSVEGCLQIILSGKMLHDYNKKFKMSLLYVVNKGIDRIIIDLSNIVTADHSSTVFIAKTSDILLKSDRKLAVVLPANASVAELIKKLKLSDNVSCFDSLNAAISYFDQKSIKMIEDVVTAMYKNMNVIIKIGEENSYSAVVINKYESTMWLSWPKNKEMNLIPIGDIIQILFLKSDGIFQFDTEVYKKVLNPTPAIVILKPAKVFQAEIRHFYRYDTRMVMQFKKFYDKKAPDDKMLVGVCTNLSAGGVQIESANILEKYDYILIYLQLPGFILNNMIGKVVRVIPLDNGKFSYGIKFTSIFEIDRLKIENYILEKMNLKGV